METPALLNAIQGADPVKTTAAAVEALYATAHWLLERERVPDATVAFRVMLLRVPTDERSWLGLGECHERLAQHNVALELYGAGTVAVPRCARIHLARARVLRRLERWDEAARALEDAQSAADESGDLDLIALVAQYAKVQ